MANKRKTGKRYPCGKLRPPLKAGDHGTGTAAALAGTVLEAQEDAEGKNPNNVYRRRRKEVYQGMGLSLRQWQAAKEIRDAYCAVEATTSGGPLKEQVDSSPRPDAVVAGQVSAQSRLQRAMEAVPKDMRRIVEVVCWLNEMPTDPREESVGARFKVAMDLVANRLRY